jgi:hypothetical protein
MSPLLPAANIPNRAFIAFSGYSRHCPGGLSPFLQGFFFERQLNVLHARIVVVPRPNNPGARPDAVVDTTQLVGVACGEHLNGRSSDELPTMLTGGKRYGAPVRAWGPGRLVLCDPIVVLHGGITSRCEFQRM